MYQPELEQSVLKQPPLEQSGPVPPSLNNQPWNNQFNNYMEEFMQPGIQLQQNSPVCDLEATLGTAGENYNVIQQTVKYFSSQQQITDLFPNYPVNIQPEDL